LTYSFFSFFGYYFFYCGAYNCSVKFNGLTSILCCSRNLITAYLGSSTVAELSIGWKAQNSWFIKV